MEGLTLGEIAKAIGLIAGMVIPIVATIRWAAKPFKDFNDTFKGLEQRVCYLEAKNDEQDAKIKDSMEQRRLLMRGMYAVLEGLKELKCNGPVTAAKDEIEEYLKEAPFK